MTTSSLLMLVIACAPLTLRRFSDVLVVPEADPSNAAEYLRLEDLADEDEDAACEYGNAGGRITVAAGGMSFEEPEGCDDITAGEG